MSYPWSKTVAGFPLPGVVVFKVYLFIRSFFGFQLPGDAFFMQNTRYLKPPSEKQIKKSDMLQKKELCFSWSEEGGHRASFFPLASGNSVEITDLLLRFKGLNLVFKNALPWP